MRNRRLLDRIRRGEVQNVAFGDFIALLEELGFRFARARRSHQIYLHPNVRQPFPVQAAKGKAKPYQVRQLVRLLEEYNLPRGDRAMKDYHINVFWSDEDETYVADIPDLFPCAAFGDSPEEALAEVLAAKQVWLEVAREKGSPIPEPTYRPQATRVAG